MAATEVSTPAAGPASPDASPVEQLMDGLALRDTFQLRCLLNSKEAGVIIGKQGKTIADMREATGCRAGVSKVVSGVQERVLSVTGTVESIAKFYSLVAAALLENPLAPVSATTTPVTPATLTVIRLLISHNHMGGIIGKAGARIKSIQDTSGAKMTASKDMLANSTERVVEVSGSAEAIGNAILEVAQCVFADAEKGHGTILFQPGGASPEAAVSPSNYLPNLSTPNGTPARRVSRGSSVGIAGSPATPSPIRSSPNIGRRSSKSGTAAPPTVSASSPSPNAPVLPPTTPAAAVAPNGETISPSQTSPADPSLRTQNISIPSDMVGCIIGRGGQKINEIRRLSGSRINIAKVAHDETGERLFSIVGLPESNEKALYLLYSSLEAEKERRTRDAGASHAASPPAAPAAEVGA